MTDSDKYIVEILNQVDNVLLANDEAEIFERIVGEHKSIVEISQEDQWVLGAILGRMLHQAYCDGRRRKTPNPDGLLNEPRLKVLSSEIDEPFVQTVREMMEIFPNASTKTLFINDNDEVVMDIANTDFTELSPYWQKDNFLAGCAATRSVITSWDGLMHDNGLVRDFVTVAVANAIHESWLARGNVGEWNKQLDTAYVQLPVDEKEKDLVHLNMAKEMLSKLYQMMKKKGSAGSSEDPSAPSQN